MLPPFLPPEPTIFRVVDFWEQDTAESMENLKSHIKYGLLSLFEASHYDDVHGLGRGNILANPYSISVLSSEIRKDLRGNIGLFMFTRNMHKIGVMTDAPTIRNPEGAQCHSLDHLIIDAEEVPIEQRQVTGIIISEVNIGCTETINQILEIGSQNNLPVYKADNMKLQPLRQ